MIAYYGSKISEHMTKTPEGFLICHDVPIARIGQQEYFAGELGLDGDPDRLVQVQRRPEDVFDPAAVASFEGKDVTQNHPPERLMPEITPFTPRATQRMFTGRAIILSLTFT